MANCLDCGDFYPESIPDCPTCNQELKPLCHDCGGCSDCVEAEVHVVRRLEKLNPCDYLSDKANGIIDDANNNKPCIISISDLIVVDGSVTVVPGATHQALEYSANGENWQFSPTFYNLACGKRKFYVRLKNFPDCLASDYVTLTEGCTCVPVVVRVDPPQTQCINNKLQYKTQDGCGNFDWEETTEYCCFPNPQPVTPEVSKCINDKKYILYYDGCGNSDYVRTELPCVACVNPTIGTITTAPAACVNNIVLDNANISIAGIANSDGFNLSFGTVNTGLYSGRNTNIVSGQAYIQQLPGSLSPTQFNIRFWNTATCFVDRLVTIPGADCGSSSTCVQPNYSLFYSNPSQCESGGSASNTGRVKMIVTSNATKYQIVQDSTFSIPPDYVNAVDIVSPVGTEIIVFDNVGFAASQQYKDYTIRVYNGNINCYQDKLLRFFNICYQSGGGCVQPTYAGQIRNPATCILNVIQNDASFQLTNPIYTTKYGYSSGVTYTGVNYASALPFSGSTITVSGLPGSPSNTTYTVRQFNGSDSCFQDVTLTIPGTECTVSCVPPTFAFVSANLATCSGTVPNNDASISITGVANATKYGYSTGSIYAGPAFSSALPTSGSLLTINGLTGSPADTTYTIRLWNTIGTCFQDIIKVVPGKDCSIACVSPIFQLDTVNPTCLVDGSSNTNGVLRIINYSNATRYQLCIDSAFTCTPNYAGATAISAGSAPITVLSNISFSDTDPYRDYTVRVYNGAADCYQTHTIRFNNPCASCCSMTISSITLTDV